MNPRFAVVIIIILSIYGLINYYIGWHTQLYLSYMFHMPQLTISWICYWLIVYAYFIGRLGSRYLPFWLSSMLKKIGSYWFAVMYFAFILLPFFDLAGGALWLLAVPPTFYVPVLGSLLCLIVLLLLARGMWNAGHPIVRAYELSIPKRAGPFKKLKIAVASDIHLGSVVGNRKLKVLVERMNALNADLVLLPGDIIDDEIEPFIRHNMGALMKQLRSRLGIYAVLGNHEYMGGHIQEFTRRMSEIGIEVLLDQSVKVADSFYVIGRKDRAAGQGPSGRVELDALLDGVDQSLPLILMDHQPYGLDKAEAVGIDVMLSGHTHRGQVMPNHLITRRLFELDWGYLKKGNLHAVVSSGFGTWGPPVRIGSRSEIIELTIHFEG